MRGPVFLLLAALVLLAAAPHAETLAVRADSVRPVSGPPIEDGVVLIEDGRIKQVGPASEVQVPAAVRTLRAAVATPGFIDAHTSAGLSGLRNVPAVRDQDEDGPDQAHLRAIDAFDPRDPLLRYLLEHGVTVVQSGPGPASPIAGQAGIFRTRGTSADAMAVRFPSAVVFNLGDVPKQAFKDKGPSTRMGTAALIRDQLSKARAYGSGGGLFSEAPEPDLGLEALSKVTDGALVAIFRAFRADDISTALRISSEFGLRSAIAGGTEAYLVREPLRRSGIPVLVGPVMQRVSTPETENATFENAALLADAEIPIALRTGFESYVPKNRILLFEAAIAAANGLGAERALRAITLDAARILDLTDDYGSLEPGKVADVVLFDGDPFEYTTHVTAVVSAGEVIDPTWSGSPEMP